MTHLAYRDIEAPPLPNQNQNVIVSNKGLQLRLYLGILGLFIFLLVNSIIIFMPTDLFSRLGMILVCVLLFSVATLFQRGSWSAAAIYSIVFCLFHFGAVAVNTFNLPVDDFYTSLNQRWINSSFGKTAIEASLMGFLAFVGGVHLTVLVQSQAPKRQRQANHLVLGNSIAVVALPVLILSLLGWFYIRVSTGGWSSLGGSYGDYLDISSRAPIIGWFYLGISLGIAFSFVAPDSPLQRFAIGLFGLWVLIALPIGLRGEVMFPLCTVGILLARKKKLKSSLIVFIIFIISLISVNLVKQIRSFGISGLRNDIEIVLNPFDSFAEMGQSIYPVYWTVYWHEQGDEFLYGASYWAPVERILFRALPGFGDLRVPADQDERLMNVLVQQRGVGSIGFSPIAEAFRNGGFTWVILFMGVMGSIVAMLDLQDHSERNDLLIAIILTPLLIQIRNDFTPIPAQIFCGYFLYTMMKLHATMRN